MTNHENIDKQRTYRGETLSCFMKNSTFPTRASALLRPSNRRSTFAFLWEELTRDKDKSPHKQTKEKEIKLNAFPEIQKLFIESKNQSKQRITTHNWQKPAMMQKTRVVSLWHVPMCTNQQFQSKDFIFASLASTEDR